jgi:hypothetical protein
MTSHSAVRHWQESHITVGRSFASGLWPAAAGTTMRMARGGRSDASRAVIVDIQGLEGGREPAPLLALTYEHVHL